MILMPSIKEMIVRAEGDRVVVLQDGQLIADLPVDAARALSKALHVKALEAEEFEKAEQIAYDQAVLLRSGVPLGLSLRKDIQREASHLASWDDGLRRYMKDKRTFATVGQPKITGGAQC